MATRISAFRLTGRVAWLALLATVASCTLTNDDVEPALPAGQVNKGNTLVFRVDGFPVVTQNYANIGSILLAFFADPRGVTGTLDATNELIIHAADSQNPHEPGITGHAVSLVLAGFSGTGTYQLAPSGSTSPFNSYYREFPYAPNPPLSSASRTFYPVATATPQVTITQWDATTRHLQGTFAFSVALPNSPLTVALTDGRFDLILNP